MTARFAPIPFGAVEQSEFTRSRLRRLLQRRAPDGSLLSVRIPVTRANRRLLRTLRAAEFVAWRDT